MFQAGLRLSPRDAKIQSNLGLALYDAGQAEDAITALCGKRSHSGMSANSAIHHCSVRC